MTTVTTLSSRAFDADAVKTTSAQLSLDIEDLTLAKERNASKETDPAYTVEISDTARAMSQANNTVAKSVEFNESVAPSLFTQAGRLETAQRYDQVFANLLANHSEEEASKRFDEFMKSEGYESMDIMEINLAAPVLLKTPPSDRNLFSHSYLQASVINDEEHILASTWTTYSNGNHTYHKKVSDSFDIAADKTAIMHANSVNDTLLDEEAYAEQANNLKNKVNELLEDAATNGNFIESNVTEDELKESLKAAEEKYLTTFPTDVLTYEGPYIGPDSEKDTVNNASSKRWAYMDDGALKISSLEEIKARLQSAGKTQNPAQKNVLKELHDHLKKF